MRTFGRPVESICLVKVSVQSLHPTSSLVEFVRGATSVLLAAPASDTSKYNRTGVGNAEKPCYFSIYPKRKVRNSKGTIKIILPSRVYVDCWGFVNLDLL